MSRTLGFDADDTLWHNENIYAATHERVDEAALAGLDFPVLDSMADLPALLERLG